MTTPRELYARITARAPLLFEEAILEMTPRIFNGGKPYKHLLEINEDIRLILICLANPMSLDETIPEGDGAFTR
jgi:hypothetical protein